MRICTRSSASRLDSGSSNRNALGWRTMARPMATRWRWPPESWRGLRCHSSSSSQDARRLRRRAPCDLVARHAAHAQAEAEVLLDRHVRVERVGLEHHGDAALGRIEIGDVLAADEDLAGRWSPRGRRSCAAASTCRSPTGRRRPRTRRRRYRGRHRVMTWHGAEALVDAAQLQVGHGRVSPADQRAAHSAPRSKMVRICGTLNSSATWPSAV